MMNLETLAQLKSKPLGHLILSLLSALLFSLPWMGVPIPTQLIAFIPLFIIADNCSKKWHFWCWCSLTIVIWTVATTYWIFYAAAIGIFASIIVSIVLFSIPTLTFFTALKKSNRALAYTLFISAWVACEYIYLWNEQISHPWLIVGNAFAVNTELIQWYEYTGALGGSLWSLVVSVVLYENIRSRSRSKKIWSIIVLFIPMIVSYVRYYTYKEEHRPIKVGVIQPNIDPYNEKFDGLTNEQQVRLLETLALDEIPNNVDYIIAPETAINDNIDADFPTNSKSIVDIQRFIKTSFPNAEFIVGATIFKHYPQSDNPPTHTARKMRNGRYYDVINGSMQIDAERVEIYNKTRLVIGVEMLPFLKYSDFFTKLSVDLGGVNGALLPQRHKEVFVHDTGIRSSANICYESIYGEFISGFVRNGAQVLFIITNDGWWHDTFGYRQHFSYARLRAIENRRSVARSANTGISGIINQRGDIVKSLGWDVRGTITAEMNLSDKKTFYTIFGDLVGRIALYVYLISMLYFVAYIYKKKSHLN